MGSSVVRVALAVMTARPPAGAAAGRPGHSRAPTLSNPPRKSEERGERETAGRGGAGERGRTTAVSEGPAASLPVHAEPSPGGGGGEDGIWGGGRGGGGFDCVVGHETQAPARARSRPRAAPRSGARSRPRAAPRSGASEPPFGARALRGPPGPQPVCAAGARLQTGGRPAGLLQGTRQAPLWRLYGRTLSGSNVHTWHADK